MATHCFSLHSATTFSCSTMQSQKRLRPVNTPIGRAIRVPVEAFLDQILPPLRYNLNPADVLQRLREGTGRPLSHRAITCQDRWRGFSSDPAMSSRSVGSSFRRLKDVIEEIGKATRLDNKGIEPSLRFFNNEEGVPTLQDRASDTLPDAFLLCGTRRSWPSLAVCGEYKKTDSIPDVLENVNKVAYSMRHCMRYDHRRRFTFAFTIENSSMTLWFCDRSQVLDHLYVIHFFLSLLYADPLELGWDPTMQSLSDGHNFDITIISEDGEARVYRTSALISDSSAQSVRSRATRVWKAIRLEDGEESGEPVALKDTWVEPEQQAEGTVIKAVRDAVSLGNNNLADQVFPRVEWHGDVVLGDDRRILDCTRSFLSMGKATQERTRRDITASAKPSATNKSGLPSQLVHYRIVYSQLCHNNIHTQVSLPKIFCGLAQIARALELLHKAGWVHRDVSTGNILLEENGNARLMDFEYATKIHSGNESPVGTPQFMAVEVQQQEFTFRPTEIRDERTFNFTVYDLVLGNVREEDIPPSPPHHIRPYVKFSYNPLHDLESLWWIAVYFIVKKVATRTVENPATSGKESKWDPRPQQAYAAELFTTEGGRYKAVALSGTFHARAQAVNRAVRPIVTILDDIRLQLVSRYNAVEEDPTAINHLCADGFYEMFVKAFTMISNAPMMQSVELHTYCKTCEGLHRIVSQHHQQEDRESSQPRALIAEPAKPSISGFLGKELELKDTQPTVADPVSRTKRPLPEPNVENPSKIAAIPSRYNFRPRRRRN
ncbi:hypothetical protein NM688_g393 [Phlebia brevispora]|uniref:Uncharacterized protein n=1 Tax=Phlebia brevispora TaxID=194682 RepID=A0ACC1TF90_9APHY|nr:hypothetical protein NM688_g393 [Phlebia brevispora]